MAISELQMALIGAGAAAVALVWAYNLWQDRQHRKTADRIFKGGAGDALLDGLQAAGKDAPPAGDTHQESGERHEPRMADDAVVVQEAIGNASPEEAVAANPLPADPASQPQLPIDVADDIADCVLHLVAAEAQAAPAVWAMQKTWAGELSKRLQWLAKNYAGGAWQPIDANDTGHYREWAAALQLVDRRGPVPDGELAYFFDGVQQVATHMPAALELPSRDELVMRAGALDEFCAGVDIQFVMHVVEASGGIFAGTKLRGVAEAAGLALEADGVFRARDEAGGEMFTVANAGAERLDADSIKSLATNGLTLSLDVPRVTDGVAAFDRMLAVARQLATALGGVLVDAQRAPLADAMIAAIRAKTAELQQRMSDGGIVPGSARALRLFS